MKKRAHTQATNTKRLKHATLKLLTTGYPTQRAHTQANIRALTSTWRTRNLYYLAVAAAGAASTCFSAGKKLANFSWNAS